MDITGGVRSLCCVAHDKSREALEMRRLSGTLDRRLRDWKRREDGTIKLLLLGCGESGKSTISKQMKIIHINGFSDSERREQVKLIRKNVRDAILSILGAMKNLSVELNDPQLQPSLDWVMENAVDMDANSFPQEFYDHTKRLWVDKGVQECHARSNEYQLIDPAKYFLDRIHEIQADDYIPTDQDMLRCRVITNTVQTIDFAVKDRRATVNFRVYDVGGQRGQRRKWLQVFDVVTAVIFVLDVASFDLPLREDPTRNRLLEAAELFHQLWNNRWMHRIPIILFLNKIDVLQEKLQAGHTLDNLVQSVSPDHILYGRLQNYSTFSEDHMTEAEVREFVEAYPARLPGAAAEPRRSRPSLAGLTGLGKRASPSASLRHHIGVDVIRTAVFIKRLFMSIVLEPRVTERGGADWHCAHDCEYYYTCAVDTQQIEKVLESTRSLIIKRHLRGWGLTS